MKYAIEAAEQLEADGISVEIIDLRTIRPLDMETVRFPSYAASL